MAEAPELKVWPWLVRLQQEKAAQEELEAREAREERARARRVKQWVKTNATITVTAVDGPPPQDAWSDENLLLDAGVPLSHAPSAVVAAAAAESERGDGDGDRWRVLVRLCCCYVVTRR